jgi:hypothetical protein
MVKDIIKGFNLNGLVYFLALFEKLTTFVTLPKIDFKVYKVNLIIILLQFAQHKKQFGKEEFPFPQSIPTSPDCYNLHHPFWVH